MTEDEYLNSLIQEIGEEKYQVIVETYPSFKEERVKTDKWNMWKDDWGTFSYICRECRVRKTTRIKRVIRTKVCPQCRPKVKKKPRKYRTEVKIKDIQDDIDLYLSLGWSARKIATKLKTSHTSILRYKKEKNEQNSK